MMSLLHSIELRNAWWLLLTMQPLLVLVIAALLRHARRDEFADAHLLPWVRSARALRQPLYMLRMLILLLAWGLLALAMAGPRIAQGTIDSGEEQALEVQVVIDLSRSMAARDVMPSRIERVRLELSDFIERMQAIRMGLVVYAARAHVMLPATTDKAVLRHSVALLDTRQLPVEGSDLVAALRLAAQQFHDQDRPRAILLISDGELHSQGRADTTALLAELKQAGIRLYVFGVGTPQGAPLLSDEQGWLQHEGRAVVTRLERERLQGIAIAGNGEYAEVSDDDADWQVLYHNGIARLQASRDETAAGENIIWQDLSAWFVLPGLFLLLLAYAQVPFTRHAAGIGVPLLLAMLVSPQLEAAPLNYADAYDLYAQGEYQHAASAFARLPGYDARLAEGVSHYRAQAWQQAAASFIQATLDAQSDAQRARALFNLGNTYFKQAAYSEAAQVYADVLRYAHDWRAAQINLDYAKALQQQQATGDLPVATREGKGARSARAADNVAITQGRLSIDGSESETKADLSLQDTLPASQAGAQRLLQSAPAAAQIERDQDIGWTYEIDSAQAIQVQHTQFSVDEKVLWQRLYEGEEGFAAPQDKPHVLPEVSPW